MVDASTRTRGGPPVWAAPIAIAAAASLLAAVWGGLSRMGWSVAAPSILVLGHGPLVANGFFGTIISLERAVALDHPAFGVVPAAAAVGTWAGLLGSPVLGATLVFGSSLGLVAIFGLLLHRDLAAHHVVMAAGAACWTVASSLYLMHFGSTAIAISSVTPWWATFLVLTIAGERLELSRLLQLDRTRRLAFGVAVVAILGGFSAGLAGIQAGNAAAGAGLLALAIWLVAFDVARRTASAPGLTGYIGRTLLGGYAWLAVGGALHLSYGSTTGGFLYDAQWHAIFVGFVLSMIFAHAPVMIRAFTGWRIDFHPALEAAPVLLHATLAVRVGADLAAAPDWRIAGGVGNAAAILVFAVVAARRLRS